MKRLQTCLYSILFSYETPKVVQIESKCLGLLHKALLVSFTVAVIVYVFIFNNGYQYIDHDAIVSVTCKVKGITYSNSTDPRAGKRIWDTADLYSHPVGDGSFFVTTNLIATHNQKQGICAEEANIGANCIENSHCEPNKMVLLGHGMQTGQCNLTTGTCMVSAWCPIENDSLPNQGNSAVLKDTADFTVYIKNHVYFPYYNTTRSNLIENIDLGYLRSCQYHPQHHPYCPIFRLGDIVSLAMTPSTGSIDDPLSITDYYFESMAIKGGVICISISWDCNLDYTPKECKPRYKFSRLDDYGGNDVAPGYNFRYSHNAKEVENRHLYKAFGIFFMVKTEATARGFHLQTFLINSGSILALSGLAPFIVEIVLLHIHKKRKRFKASKQEPQKAFLELMNKTELLQRDIKSIGHTIQGTSGNATHTTL